MTRTQNHADMHMGYALVTADTPVAQVQAMLALVGAEPLNAWLDDPLRPDGMRLRDDLLLSQIQFQHTGVLIAERDATDGPIVWQRWPQGQLFSPQADLRWEQIDADHLHVAVITARDLDAPFDQAAVLNLEPVHTDDEYLLLWGKCENKVWQEGRIPSLCGIYPAHWQGPYAALITRTYEADWPEQRSVRTVTRYIRYDGNLKLAVDPRFT